MRELYVRRRWMEKDLGKVVPVKIKRFELKSRGFDVEVKKQLNLLREETVEFRKLSEEGKLGGTVMERFRFIVQRMLSIVRDEGCYYPENIRSEVVSVVLQNGGPVFSGLFSSYNVDYSLRSIPMDCKF